MDEPAATTGARLRALFKEMVNVATDDRADRMKEVALLIWREPFTKRTWSEFSFLVIGVPLAIIGIAFVAVTMWAGVLLAITFFGLSLIALSVRGARGIGGWYRQLAFGFLGEFIEEPEPFTHRKGFLGWLGGALRDRVGWRSVAYIVIKMPLVLVGIVTGFAFWWDAFFCLAFPIWGGNGDTPVVFGLPQAIFGGGSFSGRTGFFHSVGVFLIGLLLAFAAPWVVRGIVYIDRRIMRVLLAPDAIAARVRTLERARAQTVDTSAAQLRRIERDLHDGTQAQLVALAMRLGMAKEKLDDLDQVDLVQVRQLVGDAHQGAKEAIVELRDLARGIHPPALDIGLTGALTTLAARCTIPTEVSFTLEDRPTPAIEAIAYFCVAELLANVAQHANASRASIMCSEQGGWLRVVVRDDGDGGAQLSRVGSSSSGLAGLTDRVHAVDGRLSIDSPQRGPTVVTVDLPLHA
ncbi:MAG TPA: sensor domain-containing protein [Acidimicrobiales bacterium]|jgi:signal transduction histidine kinase|nr:sensor domain-containing protein [Acidimicrobiales bacterium]